MMPVEKCKDNLMSDGSAEMVDLGTGAKLSRRLHSYLILLEAQKQILLPDPHLRTEARYSFGHTYDVRVASKKAKLQAGVLHMWTENQYVLF